MKELAQIAQCCFELYNETELQRTKFMVSELREAYPDVPHEKFLQAIEMAKKTKEAQRRSA
jgi:hypothetical protein